MVNMDGGIAPLLLWGIDATDLVPCVAELVGSRVPIHACRGLPDPTCLCGPSGRDCLLLKMGPCRGLLADFQIELESIEACFNMLSSSSHQNL